MKLRPWLFAGLASACAATDPQDVPETVRVAACQVRVDGDLDAAFERIERALSKAANQGAVLACFPETCLFGWVNPEAHEWADPVPGPTTERLADAARRYGMMIAIGVAERDGDQLYDSAVLIDRDGTLLLHHRKVNILSELMDPPYTPGIDASRSVVDTRLGRVGMLICADTFREELVDQIARAQPDLVLVPYGWAAPSDAWPGHGESLHAWIANTARRTGAPTLGVDATGELGHGPWRGYVLGGQSAFSDAQGRLAPPLADRESEVRVFELPPRS